MYQRKVDVDMLNAVELADVSSVSPSSERLCSDEGLTLETYVSQHTLYGVQHSTSTLRWYIVRFTTTPTQTKTSSHRD